VSERRWLDDAAGGPEAELREGLDEARRRLPDDVTLRRLWGKLDVELEAQIGRRYEGAVDEVGDDLGEDLAVPVRLRRPRARWPWFVGGAVSSSALALALAVWLGPGRIITVVGPSSSAAPSAAVVPSGAPSGVNGTVEAASPSVLPEPAVAEERVQTVSAPSIVRNAGDAPLRLRLRGGTETRLGPAAVLNVAADDRPAVERGEVAFSVPHQPPGQTFSVDAGPFRIVVIGTKFRLRVDENRVGVDVDEGVVEVWRHHRLARLVSGDSWSAPGEYAAPGAGAREAAPRRASATASASVAGGVSASPSIAPPPVDPAAEARAALAAGDPRRALDGYMAVAAHGGPAAENAEYEIGRILRDRLGQPGEAIAAWKRYRALHPDGLLRVETDVSIIETLVSTGDGASALGEASDFLRRHPDSERRGEIARVAGDLYRSRGDCRRAVDAYQSALSAPRGKDVTEYATFHRAECLASLGDAEGGPALEAYLRAWPSGRFSGDAGRLLQALNDRARSR
jgi:hypothetical protein